MVWRTRWQIAREPHVPRTDVLADVTAIEQSADRLAQVRRNGLLELDRQIRDAPSRVEHAGLQQRIRRTRVETSRARAAVLGLERRIRLEIDVEEQHAQEEERPDAAVDEH